MYTGLDVSEVPIFQSNFGNSWTDFHTYEMENQKVVTRALPDRTRLIVETWLLQHKVWNGELGWVPVAKVETTISRTERAVPVRHVRKVERMWQRIFETNQASA